MLCVMMMHRKGYMMEKNTRVSYAIPRKLPRIFVSFLVVISLIFIIGTPVIANPLEIGLNQSTQLKTEIPAQETLPKTNPDDGEDSPSVPDETPPGEITEPTVIDTDIVPNERNDEIITTSENTTQISKTEEPVPLLEIQSNNSFSLLSGGKESNPTIQEVTISIIPSAETRSTTDVNIINVVTSQAYETVTAEVTITNVKPQYAPFIRLEDEHEFVDSYITIQLVGDSIALCEEQVQSMTMTLKMKKNPDGRTLSRDAHIYVLTYEIPPLFSMSQSLIQDTGAPFNSGRWQPLTPIETTEDEEYVYYHVETSSYSATFAIVGTELVEMQSYQTGIPQIPWAAIILTIIIATALLVFVMFKTGFIYQVEDSGFDTNKEKFLKETNQKWSYKIKLSPIPPELQLSRSPTLYFSTAPYSPQIMTASTQLQGPSGEQEEDPMYL